MYFVDKGKIGLKKIIYGHSWKKKKKNHGIPPNWWFKKLVDYGYQTMEKYHIISSFLTNNQNKYDSHGNYTIPWKTTIQTNCKRDWKRKRGKEENVADRLDFAL